MNDNNIEHSVKVGDIKNTPENFVLKIWHNGKEFIVNEWWMNKNESTLNFEIKEEETK